ncbi:ATPase [Mycobacteroides abscessus subsp. massiliense]|nr:ATPase [Mycobacteroides abscessus subsp. massiliense]
MSFLLNRNRLNVAISRAKFQAVIVRSPALTEYLPATPDGLVELGAFLALSPDLAQ